MEVVHVPGGQMMDHCPLGQSLPSQAVHRRAVLRPAQGRHEPGVQHKLRPVAGALAPPFPLYLSDAARIFHRSLEKFGAAREEAPAESSAGARSGDSDLGRLLGLRRVLGRDLVRGRVDDVGSLLGGVGVRRVRTAPDPQDADEQ